MFFAALRMFFDNFGAVIFVPVIIFIVALSLKVAPKKAFMSALSAGVGLQGFFLVIGAYGPIVTPIVERMINETGVNLPITDLGWQVVSVIAYSTEIGMIFIGVAILLQIILFFSKYTNVFQAGDLWNNYSYMAWGSCLFVLTNNLWLSLCFMAFLLLVTLLTTEIVQKRWSTYYQYPACSIASLHTTTITVIALPINWILDKFGLYKVKSDPETIRRRLGFIGEPMTLGLFLGLVISIVGNFSRINTLAAWGEIAGCAIATAAVMAVFPKISGIFAGSFGAITEASKKSIKGFKGEWYLAVNDATGYGEPATLITGILLMPTTLGLAFILPGNQTFPMLDLLAIPYIIQPIIAMSNGNIIKSFISGVIYMAILLYSCTMTGPIFTEVAASRGVELGGAVMITSFAILGHPIPAIFFMIFRTLNPLFISASILVYAVSYALVRKNKVKIHEWIELAAAKSAGEEA